MSPPLFDVFLLELAKILQFKTPVPDDQGTYLIISHKENISLFFEFDEQLVPNTVLLFTPISPIPLGHREDIYKSLMIENHTIEETLSAKPDEDMLYLHTRFHPSIPTKELEALIKAFIKKVMEWRLNIEILMRQPPQPYKIPIRPSVIQVFPYKA